MVWVVRGTPLMIQLLIIYYFPGLVLDNPIWGGGESRPLSARRRSPLSLNYACYFSEIYRGGIQGVPVGQEEAGLVLGMTKSQIFFKVTLLQMIKRIVPPMSNEIITLVKDTSLARIIALQEIIWAGQAFMKGSQGISGAIWPHVLYRRLLSDLQRYPDRAPGTAGEEAGLFQVREDRSDGYIWK